MNKLVSILFLLVSMSAFGAESYTPSESVSEEKQFNTRGLEHVYGTMNWGPFLNCELDNNSYDRMRVVHYYYQIDFTDQYGRARTNTERLRCDFNCIVDSYSYSVFTGPRNYPNIYNARCGAYVKYRNY